MKRVLHWLVAIFILLGVVWLLRSWLMSRVFYQPDWYRDQQAADADWRNPPQPSAAREESPATAVQPEAGTENELAGGLPEFPPLPQPQAPVAEPDRTNREGVSAAEAPRTPAGRALTPLQRALEQKGTMRISADEFVPMLLAEMAGQDDFDPYDVVRGAKTTIHRDRMIIEIMVNLEKFPADQLTPEGKRIFDQISGLLPAKALQQVYFKGDLRPVASGKRIVLTEASTISVGRFNFSLADLRKRFQIDPAIDMSHFAFSRFELQEGSIVLQR